MLSPGDQATSRPTTTDEKWGQIRPSRWGQRKSSFSLGFPTAAAHHDHVVRETHQPPVPTLGPLPVQPV